MTQSCKTVVMCAKLLWPCLMFGSLACEVNECLIMWSLFTGKIYTRSYTMSFILHCRVVSELRLNTGEKTIGTSKLWF